MQCAARCQAALLQVHNRVEADDFPLKHQFLAVMLGVRRPTVTVLLHGLQEAGLIFSRYGRLRVLRRRQLEAATCECYAVIRSHFTRLGL
ncbi:MAG TPA: helix-turn-helix domain-containing protein [Vicinamibacterales bacterium]|nr:helix-turn-helix domain-containing protein [Vicinamibacterales bacterium]